MRWALLGILCVTPNLGGCTDRKPPFTKAQFEAARVRCNAPDAYVVKTAPDTIGFHGTSDRHPDQAACLEAQLAGTKVKTILLGSSMYVATGTVSRAPSAGHDRPAAAK